LRGIRRGPLRNHRRIDQLVGAIRHADAGFHVNERRAGIMTKVGNHSFRATGITAYLKNGGTLEKAAAMANHASTRTAQLYRRGRGEINLDEVERISV
jgi:integrase